MFGDSAPPVSQLLTQIHLLKVENKPVRAEDLAAVATRLVRVLEDYGLKTVGEIGQTVEFDPNRHDSISGESMPATGEAVQIRMVGITYQNKLLRKAGVL
jgi:molecular chaperone GrpE (heat shock protein)